MDTIAARGQFTKANAVLRKARKKFYEETLPTGKVSPIVMARLRDECRRRRLFFSACPSRQMDAALIMAWVKVAYFGSYQQGRVPSSFYYEWIEGRGLSWWFPGGEKELKRMMSFVIRRTA